MRVFEHFLLQGGCGIDMISKTWDSATDNAQHGLTKCTVELTSTNPMSGSGLLYVRLRSAPRAPYHPIKGPLGIPQKETYCHLPNLYLLKEPSVTP